MKIFKVKQHLFDASGVVGGFNFPVHIGETHHLISCASTLNPTVGRQSKISIIARAMSKLVNKEIGVCDVKGTCCSYVEYHTSAGTKLCGIVSYADHAFTVKTDGDCSEHRAIMMAFAAMLCSPKTADAVAMDYSAQCITEIQDCMANAWAGPVAQDIFKCCDSFYYGLAANGDIDLEIHSHMDGRYVKTCLDRFKDNNSLRWDARTARVDITPEQKAVDKDEPKKDPESLFTMPLGKFFDKCKNGEFLIDFPWNDIQKQYIVPLSFLEGFIPTETFRNTLLSVYYQVKAMQERIASYTKDPTALSPEFYGNVIAGSPVNVKVMGKPGTGKTMMIEAILASLGYPKGVINCKGRMEEDDIEGLNKFINGTVVSIPTKAGELHGVGGAIILEEINLPDPDILQGALGQALVYPYILKVNGYMEYRRHPMTIYFATMNIGTQGTKPLNEALSSRFPEGHILEDVSEDEFIEVLTHSGNPENNCRTVFYIYKEVLNYLNTYQEELVLSITMRHCLNCLEQMKIGFPLKQSVENTFISQIYSSDPDVAKELENSLPELH